MSIYRVYSGFVLAGDYSEEMRPDSRKCHTDAYGKDITRYCTLVIYRKHLIVWRWPICVKSLFFWAPTCWERSRVVFILLNVCQVCSRSITTDLILESRFFVITHCVVCHTSLRLNDKLHWSDYRISICMFCQTVTTAKRKYYHGLKGAFLKKPPNDINKNRCLKIHCNVFDVVRHTLLAILRRQSQISWNKPRKQLYVPWGLQRHLSGILIVMWNDIISSTDEWNAFIDSRSLPYIIWYGVILAMQVAALLPQLGHVYNTSLSITWSLKKQNCR